MELVNELPLFLTFEFYVLKHRGGQRGVSGNVNRGAEAITVAGLREDSLGRDDFERLLYVVESSNGGGAMLKSAENIWPIRVFRSSKLNNQYQAPKKGHSTGYRYDGLYQILKVQFTDETHKIPTDKTNYKPDKTEMYFFHMERITGGEDPINSKQLSTEKLKENIGIVSEEQQTLVKEEVLHEKQDFEQRLASLQLILLKHNLVGKLEYPDACNSFLLFLISII